MPLIFSPARGTGSLALKSFIRGPTGAAGAGTTLYDTRTAAAAATIPTAATFTQTEGYATVGDGGGALYIRTSGTTTGGFQSANGSWWKLADQTLNIKMFGAKGDGVTDDSAAIQSALNYASAIGAAQVISGVGTTINVYAPVGGDYVCGDVNLPSYVGLVTSGAGSIAHYWGARLTQKIGSSFVIGNSGVIAFSAVSGFQFVGLGALTTCRGLDFASASRCHFTGNFFEGFGLQAIRIVAGLVNTIVANFIERALLNRAAVTSKMGAIEIGGTENLIYDNEATASVDTDYTSANLYCCAILLKGADHFVHDNIGETSDVGIRVEASNCLLVANRADLNWGRGFEITAANRLVNCWSFNNSLHGTNTFSGFYTTGSSSLFTGCISEGLNVLHKYGFEDTLSSDNNKNNYVGCLGIGVTKTYSVNAFAGAAVQVLSGQSKAIADGDTTPSVDNYEQWYTVNSAPTVITNFDDGVPGQKLMIQIFDAQTSFANNATIKTPTGATVGPYTSGQIQCFININNTWYFSSNNP